MAEERKKDRGPVRLQTRPKPTSKQRRELPGEKQDGKRSRSLSSATKPKTAKQTTKGKGHKAGLKKAATAAKRTAPTSKKKIGGKR